MVVVVPQLQVLLLVLTLVWVWLADRVDAAEAAEGVKGLAGADPVSRMWLLGGRWCVASWASCSRGSREAGRGTLQAGEVQPRGRDTCSALAVLSQALEGVLASVLVLPSPLLQCFRQRP